MSGTSSAPMPSDLVSPPRVAEDGSPLGAGEGVRRMRSGRAVGGAGVEGSCGEGDSGGEWELHRC